MVQLPDPLSVTRRTPTPGGIGGIASLPTVDTSLGDAMIDISNDMHKEQMIEKARLDDVAISDAKNRYLKQALSLQTSTSTESPGYLTFRGENAVNTDIVDDYGTKLDTVSGTIAESLNNESQRQAWAKYYKSAKVQFIAGVAKHKLTESDVYAHETYVATNDTRTNDAHANAFDKRRISENVNDIVANITKEKVRAGWGPERVESELQTQLGNLWEGVIEQQLAAGQYEIAKQTLDDNDKLITGDRRASFIEAIEKKEAIDLSQDKAANIMSTVTGGSAQRKAARDIGGLLGDTTLERVKTQQTEISVQKQRDQQLQDDHDLKWVTDTGINALGTGSLTMDMINNAGLSDKTEAVWKANYFDQGGDKIKKHVTETNKDTYADWIIRATTEKDKWTVMDVASAVGPNNGGLTAEQFKTIASILEPSKTSASAAATRGKSQLKAMYDRGDFGAIETGEGAKKTDSWARFSNILVEYQQKTLDYPDVDHTDWFNDRIEQEGFNMLQEKLDDDFIFFGIGDESIDIIKKWLEDHGKKSNIENIKAVKQYLEGLK